MCCDGRAYDFSNQDRVIGTWTEIWKCLCLDLAQGEHEQGAEAAAGPQCLCPLMAGFGQRDKSTFTRQQQLASRPRVSVCPGCRAAPQGHYRWVCPKGSRCLGNGTRERTACSQLVPAASPQGTPRRDPPHQTRWEKGVSTAELSAWKFGGAWAKDACAVWVLPLLRFYLSVLKGRMARAHGTSCCSTFTSCCPCSACSLSLFSWWHFKPWPGDQTIHVFHGPFSHSCCVQAPQSGISSAESWEPQSSRDYWPCFTN